MNRLSFSRNIVPIWRLSSGKQKWFSICLFLKSNQIKWTNLYCACSMWICSNVRYKYQLEIGNVLSPPQRLLLVNTRESPRAAGIFPRRDCRRPLWRREGNVGFWGKGKTGVPEEKPLGAEWEASAFTTAPSLLPTRAPSANKKKNSQKLFLNSFDKRTAAEESDLRWLIFFLYEGLHLGFIHRLKRHYQWTLTPGAKS